MLTNRSPTLKTISTQPSGTIACGAANSAVVPRAHQMALTQPASHRGGA
jgi:hypothetical protein